MCIHEGHLEGSVSQNFDLGLSFNYMSKNGKLFLRHASLDMNLMIICEKPRNLISSELSMFKK